MSLKSGKTYTSVQFDTDLKSIREKYRQNGFLTARITGSDRLFNGDSTYVDIKITVSEGEQIKIGKINISGSTYELVKNKFNCTYRGKIDAKNKGMIDMYFVES